MKKAVGVCFAMGLAALVLSPGSASSDDFASPSLTSVELGSIYFSGGYGVAETSWRGYNQGYQAQGFNCHTVATPADTMGGATVVIERVQCYDRVGNAYIVPGSDHILRLN